MKRCIEGGRRKKCALFSRRVFLGSAAAFPVVARGVLRGQGAPSNRITIGMIGVGNHGVNRNLRMFLAQPDAQVLAVCDVFKSRALRAKSMVEKHYKGPGCMAVTDFRRVLERSDIDAIMISTPDHWHVLLSVLSIRAGKDVICEKPTLTIEEGRFLVKTVRSHRAVFQTSTEDRSLPCYHRMAEIVRNGLIGKVRLVQVKLPSGIPFPNEKPAPVPEDLDYDMWLGPAPYAPYTPNRTKPGYWREIRDYSGGQITDWGAHQLDTVQWALDVEHTGPVEVEGRGKVDKGSMYNTFIEYDVKLRYANGVVVHVQSGGTSLRFIGSEGWVGNRHFAAPLEASSPNILKWKPGPNDIRLYTNPRGEHRDFLDCVKSRRDPYFPVEVGHRCSTLAHLGNIAMILGRPLKWDPDREIFPDDPEANALKSRPMREPWRLEG